MLQDLRFAFRLFGKQRAFVGVVVLALGSGIGFTATVFAFVDGVLFKPLPYEQPDRVCVVFGAVQGDNPGSRLSVSPADFTDWKARSRSWAALEAFQTGRPVALDRGGELVSLQVASVTPGFAHMLGVRPVLGRDLSQTDSTGNDSGAPALITYEAWQRVFGGDPGVLGTTISGGASASTIVGVLPRGFVFPMWFARLSPDLLRPLAIQPDPTRAARSLTLVGRLRDGVSVSQARDEMSAIAATLKPLYRGSPNARPGPFDSAMVIPVSTHLSARTHATFATVFGSVVGLLLLTCLNACALLLARGADRTRELSLRHALGAHRRRLIRQLLVETMVLCGAAALVGLAAAEWGTRILAASVPGSMLLLKTPRVDVRLLAFIGLIAVGSALIAGLWPALRLSRRDHLSAGFAATVTATRSGRAQFVLLAAQMALAAVLVLGGALMLASLIEIYMAPTGFVADGVYTLNATLKSAAAPSHQNAFTRALSGMQSAPGVQAVALTDGPLLDRASLGSPFALPRPGIRVWTTMLRVTPGYFNAIGIPLLEGKTFRTGTQPVTEIVINRSVQRAFWPGDNPLGKRLHSPLLDREYEVVGVVGDSRDVALDREPAATFYLPFEESATTSRATFVVRTALPPAAAIESMRRELRAADAGLLVSDVASLRQRANLSIAERRFNTTLFSLFGAAGLLLAAVGAYGMASYASARRLREMGIRRVLGARGAEIARAAVGAPLAAALTGIIAGLTLACWASRAIRALLFDVQPTEPWVYGAVGLVLILASCAACIAPARRAARVDPIVALRAE